MGDKLSRHKRKRKIFVWIGAILILLVVFRLMLPWIVLRYANRSLAGINGYYGQVQDIDIALYRGAYQLDSIYLNKIDSATNKQTKFFSASGIDLSIEWRELLRGSLVGELSFYSPQLIFTKDKAEIGQVAKDTNDFRQVLKDFMPLRLNRFEIHDGLIHYVDSTAVPKVDISLKETYVLARNLKNTEDKRVKLPADVVARAKAYGGSLSLDMKMDGLAEQPTFDLTAEIKNANLPDLNDFFKAYGKFDVSKGTMGVYSEFAAADGKFKGYVKPIIKDLKVVGVEDRDDSFFQKAKESVIDLAGTILKNPKKEQVATKIPVEGTFQNSSVDNWEAVWEILKNAFIEALMPSVDNEINLSSAAEVSGEKKGFFQRLFSSGDDDDKKDDEDKKKESGLRQYNTTEKKK